MKKIRINELARELEVKAHEILDRLPELGVAEKKTHSSSIDEDVAIRLRRLLGREVPDLESAPRRASRTCRGSSALRPRRVPMPPSHKPRRSRKKAAGRAGACRRRAPGFQRRADPPSTGHGKADPSADGGARHAVRATQAGGSGATRSCHRAGLPRKSSLPVKPIPGATSTPRPGQILSGPARADADGTPGDGSRRCRPARGLSRRGSAPASSV
jgi:translation initiation factor IF-2